MLEEERRKFEIRILRSPLDQTTQVYLYKILDNNPGTNEIFLLNTLLAWTERYKIKQMAVDTLMSRNSNPP